MAGDWIAMRHELLREPEVRGMSYRLNVSRQHVAGCLLAAWSLADCHAVSRDCPDVPGTKEGHLSRYRPADIDSEVGQEGFAAAMIAEGWLYQREDGVSFPKWDNYNSSTAKQRLYERKKKQKQRGQKGQNGDKCPDVPGTKPGLQNRTEQNNTTTPTPSSRNEIPEVLSGLPEEWQQGQIGNLLCLWSNHIANLTGKPHDSISMKAMVYQFQQKGWSVPVAIVALKYSLANPHWKQVSHPTEHGKGEQSSYKVLG